MISAAPRPAQSNPGTFSIARLRHLQPGTGVGVIERERLAVAHDLLAADEHMPDRPLAGCIEQAADRIVKRLHRRVLDVDHEKIGSGARRRPSEIIAAKRAGAADRGGREDIGCTDRVRLAHGHSRQDRGGTQLLDEIMQKGVGADPEIDLGGTISPEILARRRRACRWRRACRANHRARPTGRRPS